MENLKLEIAKQALGIIANHYSVTVGSVALAISEGNTKISDEVNALCEESLAMIQASA